MDIPCRGKYIGSEYDTPWNYLGLGLDEVKLGSGYQKSPGKES